MPFAHFAKGRPKRKDTAGLNSAKSVQPSRSLARDNRQLSGESPLIGGRTACNRQAVAMSSASLQKSVGFPTNDRRPPTCPGQDRLLHRSKSAQKDNELDAQVGPSAAFVQPSRLNGDFPPRQSIRPVPLTSAWELPRPSAERPRWAHSCRASRVACVGWKRKFELTHYPAPQGPIAASSAS
jgi:hypothetical protein